MRFEEQDLEQFVIETHCKIKCPYAKKDCSHKARGFCDSFVKELQDVMNRNY